MRKGLLFQFSAVLVLFIMLTTVPSCSGNVHTPGQSGAQSQGGGDATGSNGGNEKKVSIKTDGTQRRSESTERSTSTASDTESRSAAIPGNSDQEADKLIKKARQLLGEGRREGIVYTLAALSRVPSDPQFYTTVKHIVQQSQDPTVVRRVREMLSVVVYSADAETIPEILKTIDELTRIEQAFPTSSVEVAPRGKLQEQAGSYLQPESLRAAWPDLEAIDTAIAHLELVVEDDVRTDDPETAAFVEKARTQLDAYYRMRDLVPPYLAARRLVDRMEAESAEPAPSEALLSRCYAGANTFLQSLLAADLTELDFVVDAAKDLLTRADRAFFRAREKWSQAAVQELRREVNGVLQKARSLGPKGSKGPYTAKIEFLAAEAARLNALFQQRITTPEQQVEAAQLIQEIGVLQQQYMRERLVAYQEWANEKLRGALYMYANSKNWTDADARSLMQTYALDQIDEQLLLPEARAILEYIKETCVFAELGAKEAADMRLRFATTEKRPLERL